MHYNRSMVECSFIFTMAMHQASSSRSSAETPTAPSPSDHYQSGRRFGIREGLFRAITHGGGDEYLSAFALLFHASPFHLSLLSAVPQLVGTWAQLVSVKVGHWFPDRPTQVLWGILGQSISWLPILALPLMWPHQGPWLLIAAVAVYSLCTHFTTPVWESLITDLLDQHERGRYFAKRSRVIALASFITLSIGGAVLSFCGHQQHLWIGFVIMFSLAGLSCGASAFLLLNVRSWPQPGPVTAPASFRAFLRTGVSKNFQQFLLFSGCMYVAVLISGPFFVLYMLHDLHLTHWQYGMWLAAGIVGQFVTLPGWGQFSDRFGNKALLTFTSFIVAFLPMLYLFSTAWIFLMAVNFFAGMIWAGLTLGLNNYVFDVVEPTNRGKAVAILSIVNACGWILGTLLGSWLIATVPATVQLGTWTVTPVSNAPFIFFLSGVIRLCVAFTLLRTFTEPRIVEHCALHRLVWEVPLLKQIKGLVLRSGGS